MNTLEEQSQAALPAAPGGRIPGGRIPGGRISSAARPILAWADRHVVLVLGLLALLILALGVIKLRIDAPSFEFNWENRWWQIALNLARGEGYVSCKPIYFPFCGPDNQVTAMREPLPVLLYAAIALLTGESLIAAAAFGVLVNLLIMLAVFFLARALADRSAGVLAALLWSVYLAPMRLFYPMLSGDLLAALLLTAGLVFFVQAIRENRRGDWLVGGLLLGLAVLSRSGMIVIALVLSAGLVARWLLRRPGSLRPVVLFTLTWALTIAPWIARNTLAFGRPVIGSTLAGYYLYRQNHMLGSENYLRFVSGGEFVPVLEELVSRRAGLTGRENEAQMDQIYREEALKVIRAHPLRYLELSAYRFSMLFFNWNVNEVYGKQNTFVDSLILIQHGLLLAGGAIGLARHPRSAWPLGAALLASVALYMAVMAHLPYVVAIMPLFVTLSALSFYSGRSAREITTR